MKRRLFFVVVVLFPAWCAASSVVQVEFEAMVLSSELVFRGRVVDQRAQFDNPNAIHTYVMFEVKEVWKGVFRGQTLVLRYLGGTIGNTTMHVSDIVLPSIGEEGVYFVESVARPQVHPLYGWNQGRFRIIAAKEDPAERVFSGFGDPIVGFASTPGKIIGLDTRTAMGLIVDHDSKTSRAMDVRDFKRKVLEISSRR